MRTTLLPFLAAMLFCGPVFAPPGASEIPGVLTSLAAEDGASKLHAYFPAIARIAYLGDGTQGLRGLPMTGVGFYIGDGLVITSKQVIQPKTEDEVFKVEHISIHFGLMGPRYIDEQCTGTVYRDENKWPHDAYGNEVLFPNRIVESVVAENFQSDPRIDYAVLRIKKPWPTVKLELLPPNHPWIEVGASVVAPFFLSGHHPVLARRGKIQSIGDHSLVHTLHTIPGSAGAPILLLRPKSDQISVVGIQSGYITRAVEPLAPTNPQHESEATATQVFEAFRKIPDCAPNAFLK